MGGAACQVTLQSLPPDPWLRNQIQQLLPISPPQDSQHHGQFPKPAGDLGWLGPGLPWGVPSVPTALLLGGYREVHLCSPWCLLLLACNVSCRTTRSILTPVPGVQHRWWGTSLPPVGPSDPPPLFRVGRAHPRGSTGSPGWVLRRDPAPGGLVNGLSKGRSAGCQV